VVLDEAERVRGVNGLIRVRLRIWIALPENRNQKWVYFEGH